jgi:hypothetical protein
LEKRCLNEAGVVSEDEDDSTEEAVKEEATEIKKPLSKLNNFNHH